MTGWHDRHRSPFSKPLAVAYLAVVGAVWLGTVAVVVRFLATGRASWTTHNPALVVPAFFVLVAAIGVVRVLDMRLNGARWGPTATVRMVGLIYGSAVPAALRRLRG